jgi:hypothetical protein
MPPSRWGHQPPPKHLAGSGKDLVVGPQFLLGTLGRLGCERPEGVELKSGGCRIAARAEQRFTGLVPCLQRVEQSTGKQFTPRPEAASSPRRSPASSCHQALVWKLPRSTGSSRSHARRSPSRPEPVGMRPLQQEYAPFVGLSEPVCFADPTASRSWFVAHPTIRSSLSLQRCGTRSSSRSGCRRPSASLMVRERRRPTVCDSDVAYSGAVEMSDRQPQPIRVAVPASGAGSTFSA